MVVDGRGHSLQQLHLSRFSSGVCRSLSVSCTCTGTTLCSSGMVRRR
ncbi:hypothetical protein C365_04032 [Cryptococcus neoformans Bt85]|nr:hypothetical protein C365_04032 [Cryptococcus neoformans var. grubii Bt85]OXM78384.1 hypothetical protein C364_03812 [Cryptococcus neoformans var. grubii Bt63]